MKALIISARCILVGIIFILSCKKEHSCENCVETNKPPIAVAGPDQTIFLPTDTVLLDGSNSMDPDGNIDEYQWTKVSGPTSFAISNRAAALTITKKLVVGSYFFELKVTDNGGLSAKDTVQITVDPAVTTNHPPVAIAGQDQIITLPTNIITLDGSGSSDPDNDIIGYSWAKISGPLVFSIGNANSMQTQVTNLAEGIYKFALKVTDAGGLFNTDTISVVVNSITNTNCNRPVVNAQLIPVGTLSLSRAHMAVAAAGNKIVFAGGIGIGAGFSADATTRVDIYDVPSQTWSTAALSVPRSYVAATSAGNKIFFAGGYNTDGTTFADVYSNIDVYDVSTNTWSVLFLSEAKMDVAAASVANKVYFAGGYKLGFENSNKVEIYDITTNTWTFAALSEARSRMAATVIGNDIFFAGGIGNGNSGPISNRIDICHTISNSWSADDMVEPKTGMAGISAGNTNFWGGGWNGGGCSNVEIRNPTTSNSLFSQLCYPRKELNAVLKDNKIIFFTGLACSNEAEVFNRFDIYDISLNTWFVCTLDQDMVKAAIISVNNTIYVAGGMYLNNNIWEFKNQVWKLEF